MIVRARSIFHAALAVFLFSGSARAEIIYDIYQGGVGGTLRAELTAPDYVTAATLLMGQPPASYLAPHPSLYQVQIYGPNLANVPLFDLTALGSANGAFFRSYEPTYFNMRLTFVGGIPTTPGTYALDDTVAPSSNQDFQHGYAASYWYIGQEQSPDHTLNLPTGPYQFLDTVVITDPVPEPATCLSFALGTLGLWVGVVVKRRRAQGRRA